MPLPSSSGAGPWWRRFVPGRVPGGRGAGTAGKYSSLAVTGYTLFVLFIFASIAGTARLMLTDARTSVVEGMQERTGSFARSAREVFLPRLDVFSLHFLVHELSRDKLIAYALVSDAKGRILSHSRPGMIGEIDASREGRTARYSRIALLQTFTGPGGRTQYYFSAPVAVGARRLGTAALALDEAALNSATGDIRDKMVIIFIAALVALALAAIILVLLRKERLAASLKSEMVHAVSHEFNNALATIEASIFLLEESEPAAHVPARLRVYEMLAAARKSIKLYVKNILNEARMESGKFKLEKKSLDLKALVTEGLSAMQGLIRQKNLSVTADMPARNVSVMADPEALSLVVTNLIGNAVKYTPKNGKIAIKVAAKGHPAQIMLFTIRDTGAGILAADVERIKAGFYRTESGKALAPGFGLGLKISNEMLLLHGSKLELKSEPGKGACFYFSLPLAEDAP